MFFGICSCWCLCPYECLETLLVFSDNRGCQTYSILRDSKISANHKPNLNRTLMAPAYNLMYIICEEDKNTKPDTREISCDAKSIKIHMREIAQKDHRTK